MGEEIHREAPSTFWIPAADRRAGLAAGEIVKLIFRLTVRDPETQEEQVEVELDDDPCDRQGLE
jgi:hypothetical protein